MEIDTNAKDAGVMNDKVFYATQSQILGLILRRYRLRTGLTQKELAESLKAAIPSMTVSMYYRFESGNKIMSIFHFNGIQEHFRDLLYRMGDMSNCDMMYDFNQLSSSLLSVNLVIEPGTPGKNKNFVKFKDLVTFCTKMNFKLNPRHRPYQQPNNPYFTRPTQPTFQPTFEKFY